MKTILFMLLLAAARVLGADTVTLAWNASTSGGIRNYLLHYGTNAPAFSYWTNTSLVRTQAVTLPHRGRWFFAVTAVDTNGFASIFSNVVEWESKPEPPQMNGEPWVRLSPVIERSTNQVTWTNLVGVPTWFPATNKQEFFLTRQLIIERVERVEGQ